MSIRTRKDRYDVVVAGGRAAGAATALLLARAGSRVLVVDPAPRGSDTLSTHALMRGGVLQLHRWGLLDRIRAEGTPRIPTTTFYYGSDSVEVPIKPRDGVDALYAPRRTVLDRILVEAAEEAGAEFLHGVALTGLLWDASARVRGAVLESRGDRSVQRVHADLVVGADGRTSHVAELVGAGVRHLAPHASANIFGYWPGLGLEGYHWHWDVGLGSGAIPTNGDDTCVFVGMRPEMFHAERGSGLDALYHRALATVSPELDARVRATGAKPRLRAFAGAPGVLRRGVGAGWALVGDAGYYRDPITAHGITDALRDAELLARAVLAGSDKAMAEYERTRDRLSRGLIELTDRLASFDWTLDEARDLHLRLSREMTAEVEHLLAIEEDGAAEVPTPAALLQSA